MSHMRAELLCSTTHFREQVVNNCSIDVTYTKCRCAPFEVFRRTHIYRYSSKKHHHRARR